MTGCGRLEAQREASLLLPPGLPLRTVLSAPLSGWRFKEELSVEGILIFFLLSLLSEGKMDWGLLLHCAALTFTLARALRSDKCGDTIKILSPGYLTSPGYPQSYHPSQKCEWLIQAPEPYQRIMINFNPHFDLEDRDCNHCPETPPEEKIYRRKIELKGNGSINLY